MSPPMTLASKTRQSRGRGRPWLLFLALMVCKLLPQAFCGARPVLPRHLVSLQAEAKKGPKNPVKELEEKLSKVLGRKPRKSDMVWSYQATLALPCLSNFSSPLVGGRVTFEGANTEECRRKAATGLLEALDFEKLTAEAATAEPEAKAAGAGASKKAKKPESSEGEKPTLEVGQELTMRVIRRTRNSLRLDYKGKEVNLPASELCDTFPVNVPQNNQKLQVRVLSTERGTTVTMREGSLERPTKENVEVDLSAFEGVERSTKLDAEVLGFTFQDAALKVQSPEGKFTLAQLPRKQFTEGAEEELAVGKKIQVRKKYITKERLIVTMKETPSKRPEDLEPGEEISGTVESILRNNDKPAAFLDVGFDRPAYLDWQECGDSYPGKTFVRLKVGKEVTTRVLRVVGDRIYVTCRSGDLYRPTFSEEPPKALQEIVDQFSALPKDKYLDARVLRMYPKYTMVNVKMPDGTEAEGYIPRRFYSKSFEEAGTPNEEIKVRLLPEQPKAKGRRSRVMLTLIDVDAKEAKEVKEVKKAKEVKEDTPEAAPEVDTVKEEEEPKTPEPEKKEATSPEAKGEKDDGPLKGLSDFLMR